MHESGIEKKTPTTPDLEQDKKKIVVPPQSEPKTNDAPKAEGAKQV